MNKEEQQPQSETIETTVDKFDTRDYSCVYKAGLVRFPCNILKSFVMKQVQMFYFVNTIPRLKTSSHF